MKLIDSEKPSLTKVRIVDTAIELLDAQGWEQFSLRGLARELGVHVTTLRDYYPHKSSLFRAVWAKLHEEFVYPPAGLTWQEHLRFTMQVWVDRLVRHPYIIPLAQYAEPETALRRVESELAVLINAGFTPEAAARAFDTLRQFTLGWAVNQTFSNWRLEVSPKRFEVSLADTLPNFAAAAPYIRENELEVLRFGLDSLLQAIERDLQD